MIILQHLQSIENSMIIFYIINQQQIEEICILFFKFIQYIDLIKL
jgi:hypothetical protein